MDPTASAPTAGSGGVLRVPDFRRLALALTADSAGSWAYGVVLLVYVFGRTHSATWVGVTVMVRFLPGLFLGPYAGVVAEKYERTRVMVTSALICTGVMCLMAAAVVAHAPVAVVVALAVISAAAYTPFQPAAGALVPQVVREDQLSSANAVIATIDNLTIILGPGIGGLMLLLPSAAPGFLLNGASYLVAAVLVARLHARSTPTDVTAGGSSLLAQVSVGARALATSPAAAVPVMYAFLASFVYGTDSVLFVPVSAHLHGGKSGYGYLLAAQSVGGVAVAALAARLSSARVGWWIYLGMLLYTLPSLAIPPVHAMLPGLGVQVVRGVGTVFVDVLAMTALQRSVPHERLSRVLGLFVSLVFAATALGALITPAVLNAAGLTSTLVILSLVVTGVATAGLGPLLRVDRAAESNVEQLQPTIRMLSGFEPFAEATPAALEQLAAAAAVVKVAAGEAIVCEGDAADAFYVVEDGEVQVTSSSSGGVMRVMPAPAFFGEIGLLHHVPRTATVTATRSSRLLRITADDFESALNTSARAGLHAVATSRLRTTAARAADAGPAPVEVT